MLFNVGGCVVPLVPPSVAGALTDLTVTVNIQTTLSCEATGIPKPSVTWTKNGRALHTDQNQNLYRWGVNICEAK